MRLHHILVPTHRRTGLSRAGRKRVCLCRRFIYEREEIGKVESGFFHNLLAKGIAVIYEVAGEHGCEVQAAAVFAVHLAHSVRERFCHLLDRGKRFGIIGLYEERHAAEVNLALLRERLQGIDHRLPRCTVAENADGNAACRMDIGGRFAEPLYYFRSERGKRTVLYRKQEGICLRHVANTVRRRAMQGCRQLFGVRQSVTKHTIYYIALPL